MRNKRTFLFAGLVLGLALVFGITTGAMAGNIRIGVAAPFTDDLAGYGDNIKAGVNLTMHHQVRGDLILDPCPDLIAINEREHRLVAIWPAT